MLVKRTPDHHSQVKIKTYSLLDRPVRPVDGFFFYLSADVGKFYDGLMDCRTILPPFFNLLYYSKVTTPK